MIQGAKDGVFVHGSQTSTVIPYHKLLNYFGRDTLLLDLGGMPRSMNFFEEGRVKVLGPVDWGSLKSQAQAHQRDIMVNPTEEAAQVLSGLATSATGERSFAYGAVREQVRALSFMDGEGQIHHLNAKKKLLDHPLFQGESRHLLLRYQESFSAYSNFKNGPFPRLEFETDLLVGFEGQTGVILEADLETAPWEASSYYFIGLPSLINGIAPHLEVFQKVQKLRGPIKACEYLDIDSLSYLEREILPFENKDVIFLEVAVSRAEEVFETLFADLETIPMENIVEVSTEKCLKIRKTVPRMVAEKIRDEHLIKKGTDAQVPGEKMGELLEFYRSWKELCRQKEIPTLLFGHFGDAHLHFNFLPTSETVSFCDGELNTFYAKILDWQGSPFAEHGVGLIKKNFMRPFYSPIQKEMFSFLKEKFDPENKLFRLGFMAGEL
jgi:glycolate oxidase